MDLLTFFFSSLFWGLVRKLLGCRALLGAQIRGYCQQASEPPPSGGPAKYIVGGAVSAVTFWHLVIGMKLNRLKEKMHAHQLAWEAQKK